MYEESCRSFGEELTSSLTVIVTTGGLLPPAPNGLLRMTRDETFSHYIHHKASNQTLSVPPKFKNRLIWGQDVPQGLKDECREVLRKSLGEQAEGLEIEHHRLCWYVNSTNAFTFSSQNGQTGSRFFFFLLFISLGTHVPPTKLQSSPPTLIAVTSTSPSVDPSTPTNFYPSSVPMWCRCCTANWNPTRLSGGHGIGRLFLVEELMDLMGNAGQGET